MKIATLMTCYNRVKTTLRCLKQLVAQKLPPECQIDIYLVDDASPDQTGAKVQEWFSSLSTRSTEYDAHTMPFVLRLIAGNGNLFWCKGMRLAWDTAIDSGVDYDFYLWVNDDVNLKSNVIHTLIDDWHKCGEGESVIVGAFSSDESERDISYSAKDVRGKDIRPNGKTPILGGGYLNGNLVLIPRKVYQAIGPISGAYSHAYGDYDYGVRLCHAGIPIYCSSQFCGTCKFEADRYKSLRGLRLVQRLRLLTDPKGYNLRDTFIYRYNNFGLMRAIVSCCHVIYLVVIAKEIRS